MLKFGFVFIAINTSAAMQLLKIVSLIYYSMEVSLRVPYLGNFSPDTNSIPAVMSMDSSTVSVNSREGCVMKCGSNFLNSSDSLPFERSPTKPVLTVVYTYYSLWRHILTKWTHHISQRNYTFYSQFLKLTTIRCKWHGFSPWRHDHTRARCFLKGICQCVAHWFGLVYADRVWHSAHLGWGGGTLQCSIWRKQTSSLECMFGGILQHDQSCPKSHNNNILSRVLQHMRICNG